MNKADLVASIAKKSGLTKKASEEALEAIIYSVKQALTKEEKIRIISLPSVHIMIKILK